LNNNSHYSFFFPYVNSNVDMPPFGKIANK
jgi:hypothetical protein